VLCRELTKLHEEVRRGSLAELAVQAAAGMRGEVTLVIAGLEPPEETVVGVDEQVARVAALVAAGAGTKHAVAEVAAATGASRRELYQAVLDARSAAEVDGSV